ncbi:arsenic resistance protein [Bhargavaea ginsengi]|uniref:arsenic resistance protein n=1 Tax=Bhargavaea ginsengi TaxID=426757 RepID=UPI00203ED07B|nr:arsenic resistance protein [Bhargavaea ginsengi]MCM3086719.1 arsenic resistance protein [Bhargavaea ginsengi]
MLNREKLENNQVLLYIVVLAAAFFFGFMAPELASRIGGSITIIIAILMYSMFSQIPFVSLKDSFSNRRYLAAVLLTNYIAVPIVVWIFSRFLPDQPPLLLGFFLVLLTPCIDYVIVFTALGDFSAWLPVPFMALTLFVVVASQIAKVSAVMDQIIKVIPLYIAFMIIMPIISRFIAKRMELDTGAGRALVFSGSTRNSLVVLPLALALPGDASTLVAAVIVTQTIVELAGELLYIRWVPKLVK